ncbi:hypothetical protein FVEN_g5368 [Fusarium venenatum]|uniref:Subtelomeric hrmA-associated cluster protein AFUB-079030/YDR124W-like helical bundle domain-containing protein n=1 Tax=Fusarium venenatum TaxID=56646 RepID=A0A2L2U2A1_9HYPO|nr:uncharacterized protein FVRRES_08552 [Fusarium venenatum]KAG8356772.1 hypothetical protein FVEN_g5368 [Fusarium venenatum]KAH6965321.1 hypothetical protein EDB82DRAFT_479682 [Fusarium venenatum]CEI68475.1 unnamed protein product [Fusarium venenatum]
MVREWSRESFPRYPHHPYLPERFVGDGIDDSRFPDAQDMHRRQPPIQIDEALRQSCGISARRYFLVVVMDDGSPQTFSGPGTSGTRSGYEKQFFDMEKYLKVVERLDAGASPVINEDFSHDSYKQPMDFPRNRQIDRRRMSQYDDWETSLRQGRKRPRARHGITDDDDIPMTVATTIRKCIKIGNSLEVGLFYDQRFKNCQQTACKLMAKAWVKAVEPKKQSTHPYTGSDEKAPDWWPKPWGPTKEDKVRHKEPDHLYKRERVHLLNHILRMIVEPNARQHPDIQKLKLNVQKLEEITIEALSGFFADKDNPANAKKRPFLNEIFKVAREEERLKLGEIDGTTEVFVMADDKIPESYVSGNDDHGPILKEEEDHDVPPNKLTAVHGLMPSSNGHGNTGASLHGTPFLGGDLPVRGNQYTPSTMPEMPHDQHAFVENTGIPVNGQPSVHATGGNLTLDMGVPPAHDASRRASIFSAHSEYGGQNNTAMYTQQWQPGSTAPNSSSMYTFTQQPPSQPATTFVSPGVAMNPAQSYMNTSFDGLARGYDPNQNPMFRTGSVQQPTQVHPAHGYDYMSHDNRGLPGGVKVDDVPRHAMH